MIGIFDYACGNIDSAANMINHKWSFGVQKINSDSFNATFSLSDDLRKAL